MALYDPFAPKPKCTYCDEGQDDKPLFQVGVGLMHRDCYIATREPKSVWDAVIDLELAMVAARRHQHVENMRF